MALNIGDPAPYFELKSDSGEIFRLSEQILIKPCVLYFYPKNFTPDCTKQACEFRDRFKDFSEISLDIIGISGDSATSHSEFKKQYNLPFRLLSDPGLKVSRQFKAVYPIFRIPKRVTYLIGSSGLIEAVFENYLDPLEHITKMLG